MKISSGFIPDNIEVIGWSITLSACYKHLAFRQSKANCVCKAVTYSLALCKILMALLRGMIPCMGFPARMRISAK